MEMAKFSASFNTQRPLDWLKYKQPQQGQENQQWCDKCAMSKEVVFLDSFSQNSTYYNII